MLITYTNTASYILFRDSGNDGMYFVLTFHGG